MMGIVLPAFIMLAFFFGIVFLRRGVRGGVVFSEPRCARCDYDLRAFRFDLEDSPRSAAAHVERAVAADQTGAQRDPFAGRRCPECGDHLDAPGAVNFARPVRKPRLIWTGIAIMVLPALLILAVMFKGVGAVTGPGGVPSQTTASLLTDLKNPQTAGQPWHWQELERRFTAGRLSTGEQSEAVERLIAHVANQTAAFGRAQPLHWVDGFFKKLESQNVISPAQFDRLCQAHHGTASASVTPRIRPGKPLDFTLGYGTPWNLPNTTFVYAIRDIRLDGELAKKSGTPLTGTAYVAQFADPDPDWLSESRAPEINGTIALPEDLSPGPHEIEFTIDAGVLSDPVVFTAIQGRPGQKERWTGVRSSWTSTVRVPFRLLAPGEQTIELVTDEASDPLITGAIARPIIRVRRSRSGVELQLHFAAAKTWTGPPIFSTVQVDVGGKVLKSTFSRTSANSDWQIPFLLESLAPEIRQLTVVLKPNVELAEGEADVTRIWGRDIRFDNVPIDRFDLAPAATSQRSP